MRLVKLETSAGNPIYVNPDHVVAVHKGLRDTRLVTVTENFELRDTPEVVARLLGTDEIAVDVTPRAVTWSKDE